MMNLLSYYQPHRADITGLLKTDICIYGATAGGIAAAIQASDMGKKVVLLEPSGHLGGMTSSGLSYTDAGKKEIIGGLASEFYRRCGEHYGQEEEWRFEPKIAKRVFSDWLQEKGIQVHFFQYLQEAIMSTEAQSRAIREIVLESGLRVQADIFIDTTYEGDLMAAAGVSFTVGREGNSTYGETYNGAYVGNSHHFELPVDPYLIPGDQTSGLLPGVTTEPIVEGEGDHCVQAYNFRLILTQEDTNRIPFEKPAGYDEREYELLARYYAAGWKDRLLKFDPIKGAKVDMNNSGAVSTDFIGRNFAWPEATYEQREILFQEHVCYQKGLLWFRGNDPRVPESVRSKINTWGLAADEFPETGGWPPQLYIREGRRMKGDVVMTEHHCFQRDAVEDPVGMASYTLDSHNCRRLVKDGVVINEGNVEVAVTPFSISWRSIIPKIEEVTNLLVPTCLSASHTAYGSIRMEPVFMILAQSAATAAAFAIDEKCPIQKVPYSTLRERLLFDGQILNSPQNGD